jgi:hypothetical protein
MKIARLAFVAALAAALAAPGMGSTAPALKAIPLSAPAPSWYTPDLHAKVLASGVEGVALPESVAVPTAGIAFLGIRPGHFIIVGGGTLCSTNFVFRNGANWAIGTAGHCGNVGDQVTMISLPRGLLNIGNIIKSVNGGPGNDFALISINPALNSLVSPSMAFWGGPTANYPGPKAPLLVRHIGWGAGIGAGGTPRVGVGIAWSPTLWRFSGLIVNGDSGSGAINEKSKAIGNITHIQVDTRFLLPVFNSGTAMPRILAIAGLPLATCGPSPWPLYGCPGL